MLLRKWQLALPATLLLFSVMVVLGALAGSGTLARWLAPPLTSQRAGLPPLFVHGADLITAPGRRVELLVAPLPPDEDDAPPAPGVTSVQVPVDLAAFAMDKQERERVLARVERLAAGGLYPLITAARSLCSDRPDAAGASWKAVAQATARWPGVVFDLGETGCAGDWDAAREAAAHAADGVRAVSPTALVVVAAPPGFTAPELAERPVPRDGILYRLAMTMPDPAAPAAPLPLAGVPLLLELPPPPTSGDRRLLTRMAVSEVVAARPAGWLVPATDDPALTAAVQTALAGAARAARVDGGTLPRLRAVGNRLADNRGATVRLKGFNRPGLEVFNNVQAAPTEHDLDAMAQVGANLLRLPVNPVWYRSSPEYRAAVINVIARAEARRMYTVLDLHWSTPAGEAVCFPDMAMATRFWQEAAFDLRGTTSVLYNIYNEPCKMDWATWRPLAERLIDAVRAVEPDALVVVPGVDWAFDLRGVATDPVRRDNLVYDAHDYPWKAYLDREQAYGYLADQYPVIVGEFGADYLPRFGFYQDPVAFTRQLLEYADRRGLAGWAAWAWHADIPPQMFQDWTFTPTPFGQTVLDHLAASADGQSAS